MKSKLDHVDYNSLDKAKNAFIQAGKRTLKFAEKFGFIPDEKMGASANVFALDLKPFLKFGAEQLFITLLPEGLGTSDEACPEDLTGKEALKFWYNIGIKTVAVMTNDAASTGMQTILLSLYLPSGSPETVFNEIFIKGFLDGFVEGCRQVGCVYFSGETPQLKSKFIEGKLDIAGALFGLVPAGKKPIDSSKLAVGDKIVFVESSGPHDNGFTTLRKIAADLPGGYRTRLPSGMQYFEAINKPTILYTAFVQNMLAEDLPVSNVEPITGHGWQKLMRSRQNFRYVIHDMLPVPEIFTFIETVTGTPPAEMIRIFNYGVGLAVFCRPEGAEKVVRIAGKHGLKALIAGEVEKSANREVVVEPMDTTLEGENFLIQK